MAEKPKRFMFDLGDDDRAALEAARIKFGHRSGAEMLRALIRSTIPPTKQERDAFANAAMKEMLGKLFLGPQPKAVAVPVDIPLITRKAHKPHPKPGKR